MLEAFKPTTHRRMAKIKTAIPDFRPDPRLLDERGATEQRFRHAEGAMDIGDTGLVSARDTPLERAYARRVITGGQYHAGVKFRLHWRNGGLAPSLNSIDLNRIFSNDMGSFSHMAKTEAQAGHRLRFRAALRSIGQKGAHVLYYMICLEEPLDKIGSSLGWNNKVQGIAAAIEIARSSLDILCHDWGIDRDID